MIKGGDGDGVEMMMGNKWEVMKKGKGVLKMQSMGRGMMA